jgi:hypothetical protein
VGLERSPLSLVSVTEKLRARNSLENREYCRRNPLRWPCDISLSRKVGTNFTDKRRSLSRSSSLTDPGHSFFFNSLLHSTIGRRRLGTSEEEDSLLHEITCVILRLLKSKAQRCGWGLLCMSNISESCNRKGWKHNRRRVHESPGAPSDRVAGSIQVEHDCPLNVVCYRNNSMMSKHYDLWIIAKHASKVSAWESRAALAYICCIGAMQRSLRADECSPLYRQHRHHHKNGCSLLGQAEILNNKKQTPFPESANELYRPSDRRLSANLVPTFADRGCPVISVTDSHCRILAFYTRTATFSFK